MPRKGTCSDLVLTGICQRRSCPFLHDVSLFCRQCSLTSFSPKLAEKHLKSWQHKQLSRNCKPYCNLCNEALAGVELLGRGLTEKALWERHTQSDVHRERAERDFDWVETPFPAYRETTAPQEGHVRCEICHIDVLEDRWEEHIVLVGHRVKRILSIPRRARRTQYNAPGVSISLMKEGINFGVLDVSSLRSTSSISKGLVVTSHSNGIAILGARMRSVIEDRSTTQTAPGQRVTLQVNFVIRDRNLVGVFNDHVEIQFRNNSTSRNFVICRTVRAEVGNREELEKLMPKVEYRKPAPKPAPVVKAEVMETVGDPWEDPHRVVWKKKLPEYPVPEEVFNMVVGKNPKGLVEQVKQKLMPKKTDLQTYGQYWQNLLFLEELQQREDLRRYSMEAVTMTQHGRLFKLPVPGLAEKRPSVIVGDLIKVRLHGEQRVTHGGYVHRIDGRGAFLSLHYDFPYARGLTYDVEFTLNRLPFRRQHQAVLTKDSIRNRFLFPEWSHVTAVRPSAPCLVHFAPLNRTIRGNQSQEMAISRILSMGPGSAPFIIHGPFGTGKTTTLVEAIQQLYARDNDVRILACAPSNSAADNIATRLQNVGRSNLLRMNATTREYETLQPPDLKRFQSDYGLIYPDPEGDGMRFHYPDLQTFMQYKIVVTTCVTAGVPSGLGVKPGHFDWIFIDEAGQAAEPEVLIPILSLSNHNTNVVLAGDHKQLGPIIHSPISKVLGHSTSYLYRLMEMEMYDEQGKKGQKDVTVVKLRRNFRNHVSILQFPNEQFYSGDLIAGADPMTTDRLLGWIKMPNPDFPIKFHGVVGKDQREDTSPSYFNSYEVLEVKYIVEEILELLMFCTTEAKDIGIIAPYSAQCSKIRKTLDGHQHRDIKVGSVEEFQGQERPIIIISTTRSSPENVAFDLRHTLGFVANPRRMNVAITRAQAGLFVVGNPHVLSLDPLWRALLNYIRLNKGYSGPTLDPRWDANEEIDLNVPDIYVRQRQQEHAANMESLERRIRGTVLRRQGLEAEDRYSDEEDEVVYVSRMEGGGTGWADSI
ncbi:hypothetical protein M407DRAFT_219502 [Tulasnella calospora MUT 4182]|uniref:RNA helicase n=1 Tax=Tulasnella calospora MUT 4182 TaxID=1051891 RepID=A0A0C3LHU3_9AGAM|nr:hypothetical protein M407DRAFT_219502 [Tulasnella calospora MUT 4182]